MAERRRNRLSMTQKRLNITQRLACSEEGWVERSGRDPQVLASDSVEKTTARPRFHGTRTAGSKGSALSRVGWSTESLMKRIFKRI